MRYLILSDVHGNQQALRAVLAHAARKRRDKVLFLGDAVGYGAAPNQVLESLRRLKQPLIGVRGNHDRVALDLAKGAVFFNSQARLAAAWTGQVITGPNRRYLEKLPQGPRDIERGLAICHGSPVDEDEYLFTETEARGSFDATDVPVMFFGHSHVPCMFESTSSISPPTLVGTLLRGTRVSIDLDPTRRYLINPGSVGQPRDRDPRASYAQYDSEARRLTLFRVAYDVEEARRRILAAGLPPMLGDRLLHGS